MIFVNLILWAPTKAVGLLLRPFVGTFTAFADEAADAVDAVFEEVTDF